MIRTTRFPISGLLAAALFLACGVETRERSVEAPALQPPARDSSMAADTARIPATAVDTRGGDRTDGDSILALVWRAMPELAGLDERIQSHPHADARLTLFIDGYPS